MTIELLALCVTAVATLVVALITLVSFIYELGRDVGSSR
jgi:hypothetical protein